MTGKYDDMLCLPHHVSRTRARMSLTDRGAQFSPFSALVGYDAVIEETARRTGERVELTESEKEKLNEKLCLLLQPEYAAAQVMIEYFLPDLRKNGGEYATVTGTLRRIDPLCGLLVMSDGTQIPIEDIRTVESDWLPVE